MENEGSADSAYVGEFHITCDKCSEDIPVAVFAYVEETDGPNMKVWCEPDVSEVWSHSWGCNN